MITVTKEKKGDVLQVRFVGSIDETANFQELVGELSPELRLGLKEISMINSSGARGWIRYFHSIVTAGTRLTYFECSTAIVEQINLIPNFACGAHIESIYVPFACVACKKEFVSLFKSSDLKQRTTQFQAMKCPKCGDKVVFDDLEQEYFRFLSR